MDSGGEVNESAAEQIERNRAQARQNLRRLASEQPQVAGPTTVRDARSAVKDTPSALPKDKRLGDYIEFDLTRLRNSKGGFLVEENEEDPVTAMENLRKEREREKQRLRDQMEPGMSLDPTTRPVCEKCSSPDVLYDPFLRVFNVRVCRACERACPETYSLLTKTEVKEDYLLTDAELADGELLPHLLKKNPHKSTYSNMMLFLRKQVEEYAFSATKWGSADGLDAEYARRHAEKSRKRVRKFQQGLAKLRKRTIRDNIWQQRQDAEHTHQWIPSGTMHVCQSCGQRVEVEEF
ncbi:DNA repair protein rad14 [Malassezia psittaci]|uniref:DNA repair protein rad14 n=1 Tax=Malassezia psittaci TaxID=1821823 RepID=A0AAF0JEQ6_9BASI|nr:DNA repair protein rad14 [Malassezia psittaci]